MPNGKVKHGSKVKMYILTIAFAALCILLVSIFWREPKLLTALLMANAAFMIFIGKPKHDLFLFLCAGVCGSAAEIFAISYGSWSYPMPDFSGIPIWLSLVWGTAGVFLVRLSNAIGDWIK